MAVKKAMTAKNGGAVLKAATSSRSTARKSAAKKTEEKSRAATASAPAKKVAPARATPTRGTVTKSTPKTSAVETASVKRASRATVKGAAKTTVLKTTSRATVKGTAKTAATKSTAKTAATKSTAKTAAVKGASRATVKGTARTTAKAATSPTARSATRKPSGPAQPKAPVAAAPLRTHKIAASSSTERTQRMRVRKDETPWTATELRVVRTALEADVARLGAEIEEAEYALAGLMRDAGDGAGDDQADAGTKTFEREQEISLANNAREMYEQSQHALERIVHGSYGICESCGNPIGKNRLLAFPRATLCVPCKSKQERR